MRASQPISLPAFDIAIRYRIRSRPSNETRTSGSGLQASRKFSATRGGRRGVTQANDDEDGLGQRSR